MYDLNAYPIKTSMTKYHLSGLLEGSKTQETMGFMTWNDACTWAGEVTMSTKCSYVVLELVNLATGEKEHF
jgi:hypothetical protein